MLSLPKSRRSRFSLFRSFLTPLYPTYPKAMRSAVLSNKLLNASNVHDDVDVEAVGVVVVVAASSGGGSFAGAAHVSAFDDVAQALEGAVVLAPAVLDQGVAEAHVVLKGVNYL